MTSGELGINSIESGEPPEIDTSVAHSARIYDYILGGKDNFESDRRAAEAAIARNPTMAVGMRANRARDATDDRVPGGRGRHQAVP